MAEGTDWQSLANITAVFGAVTGGLSLSLQGAAKLLSWHRAKQESLSVTLHSRDEATYLDLRIDVSPRTKSEGLFAKVADAKRSGLRFCNDVYVLDHNEFNEPYISHQKWAKQSEPQATVQLDALPGHPTFVGRCLSTMPAGSEFGWVSVSVYNARNKRIISRTLPISVIN